MLVYNFQRALFFHSSDPKNLRRLSESEANTECIKIPSVSTFIALNE